MRDALIEARESTLALIAPFAERGWAVPYLAIVNPPLWELGHVGWFQERWCLRPPEPSALQALPGPSMRADADALYDSSAVAHARRWSLPLPTPDETRAYLRRVLDETLQRLERASDDPAGRYRFLLSLYHELMHAEAFTYTAQTLGYAAPGMYARTDAESPVGIRAAMCGPTSGGVGAGTTAATPAGGPGPEMLSVAAARVELGFDPCEEFLFDNEMPAFATEVAPFSIAAAPVRNAAFRAFVEEGGYRDSRWWDPQAFARLRAEDRDMPVYWRIRDGILCERRFDDWLALDDSAAVRHVSAHEAEAWCRWAGGRLPSEAEWALAARSAPGFDWGREVWEWTSSPFEPFPGFAPGPYRDYSRPWFGDHRVVRGASFATPRGLVDTRFRNFYQPHRSDLFIGFRVCRAGDAAAPA